MSALFQLFLKQVKNNPDAPALVIGSNTYSYSQLAQRAGRYASLIATHTPNSEFVGFYAGKSVDAYAAILGILQSGKAYVPLNPKFAHERTQSMIALSGLNTVVVAPEKLEEFLQVIENMNQVIQVIIDSSESALEMLNELPESLTLFDAAKAVPLKEPLPGTDLAYVLFTSGSTGVPKGVPIAQRNVCSYVSYLSTCYEPEAGDRFSQTFDLTFDLSVHDMFLCWANGAALYPIPKESAMAPAAFIKKHELTFWFSVPSVAVFMSRFRMLKEDAFPSLRYSLFCGEPLPASLAEKWQRAAANSILENIYGPTEATIGISRYRWNADGENQSHNGVVSIGQVFESQDFRIVDEQNHSAPAGTQGELLLQGDQVFAGYLNVPQKTAEVLVELPDEEGLWYRTGDIVFEDEDGNLNYCNRKDFQVQIRGHRVELGEVDRCIRQFTAIDGVVTIAHPIVDNIAQGLCTFLLEEDTMNTADIAAHCKSKLPDYMVPAKFVFLEEFPLNANGKVDRLALAETLNG